MAKAVDSGYSHHHSHFNAIPDRLRDNEDGSGYRSDTDDNDSVDKSSGGQAEGRSELKFHCHEGVYLPLCINQYI